MTRRVLLIDGGIILAAFLFGGYVYHLMPAEMPVHWGINGQPDNYAGRFAGVFGIPIVMAVVVFLMIFLPWLDPEDAKLPKHYNVVVVIVPAFLFAIYIWTIFWSLGIKLPAIVPVSEAILFFTFGIMLKNLKRNSKIGVKLPWVLSSDLVWEKTHRLIGILFQLSAAVVLAGLVFPQYEFYLSTIAVIVTPLFAIVYSYVVYRKEAGGN